MVARIESEGVGSSTREKAITDALKREATKREQNLES